MRRRQGKLVATFALAASLVACGGGGNAGSAGTGAASETATSENATSEDAGSATTSDAASTDELPAKFDLREKGFVTPVKEQGPWGACWSFGGIAAAETSILSTLGMTRDQYKEKTGYDFDLSENHLIWFSRLPITPETNSEQAGEGLYVRGWMDDGDQLAMYDGGDPTMITAMFANGVGPVDEDLFPYRGAEGITDWDYFSTYDTDPADVQAKKLQEVCKSEEEKLGMRLETAVEQVMSGQADAHDLFSKLYFAKCLDESWPEEGKSAEELLEELRDAYYKLKLDTLRVTNTYTTHDDWVIPVYEETEDGQKLPNRDVFSGYTMLHGNMLPEPVIRDDDGNMTAIDESAIAAIKGELFAGRGVSIRFFADQSLPGQELSKNGFMNQETWAQYTYDDMPTNHGVCIVGWDDTITADMFNSDPAKQPPADGAWIVKNSWGSETEYSTTDSGQTIGYMDWGMVDDEGKHTGYFYLSYYDKSMDFPESMVFDTDFAEYAGKFRVYAHDYMPSTVADWNATSSDVLKCANVFVNDTGDDQEMRAVATTTAYPGDEVTFSVYLLSEGAESPEDGELVATQSATFEYKGFHRVKLDEPVKIKDGQRFAVVAMEKGTDENGADRYAYNTVSSNSKKYAEENDYPSYGVTKIHEGESYVFDNGAWSDWTEGLEKFKQKYEASDDYVFDNLPIKAYLVVTSE